MRYCEAVTGDDYRSPPSIYFDVSIPASDYSLLLNNVREGITPSSVTVGLRDDKGSPLECDAYAAGDLIWRNATEQNWRVDVQSIKFHYQLIGAGYHGDEDTKLPTAKASIDAASVAIVGKLADLEKAFVKGNLLIVTVILIAFAVACAVLYFTRH